MQRIAQVWLGWQVDELIGQGAFGKVYRASRTAGGVTSQAAIKVIDIPRDESEVAGLTALGMDALSVRSYFEDTAQSVMREVALLDQLKSAPGIVHIEDYQLLEREDGVGWTILIRMELLEALPAYVARVGTPGPREVANMGAELAHALARCHQLHIIHRDVKPENVFVSPYGEYKLGDFGLARTIAEGSHSTMSHAGANAFMAPEVLSGHYDHRVDVYSLGLMLYRQLNGGRPPFVPATGTVAFADVDAAQMRRMSGERPPLPAGAGVDQALADIVRRAVEPKPKDRWQSAEDLASALQRWLDGETVPESAAPADTSDSAGRDRSASAKAVSERGSSSETARRGANDPAAYDPMSTIGHVARDAKPQPDAPARDGGNKTSSAAGSEKTKDDATATPSFPNVEDLLKEHPLFTDHKPAKDDAAKATPATPPKPKPKRSPASTAVRAIACIVLDIAIGYVIYLTWHYTLDDAFAAAHPVIHWLITLHGIFWWITDPLLIGVPWAFIFDL